MTTILIEYLQGLYLKRYLVKHRGHVWPPPSPTLIFPDFLLAANEIQERTGTRLLDCALRENNVPIMENLKSGTTFIHTAASRRSDKPQKNWTG